jgi:hypothetical protein
MTGKSPWRIRREGGVPAGPVLAFAAALAGLAVAAWLVAPVRAALVLALLVVPVGYACLTALSRDHSRALVGLSRAAALGLAAAALVPLAVNLVGLNRWSLWASAVVVDAVALAVLGRRWRGERATRPAFRWAWPARAAARSWLLPLLAVVSVLGTVVVTVHLMPEHEAAPRSTRFFFEDGGRAPEALRTAPASSVVPVVVALARAPGDSQRYQLRLSVSGQPTRIVTTLSPSDPATVTVPLTVPTGGCAFRVSLALFAAGGGAPAYQLTAYGSGGVGKSCASTSRSGPATAAPPATPRG